MVVDVGIFNWICSWLGVVFFRGVVDVVVLGYNGNFFGFGVYECFGLNYCEIEDWDFGM